MPKTYNRNVEIKDLPVATNNILNTLAKIRGVTKVVIVRESLIEYAKNHVGEIAAAGNELNEENDDDSEG